MVGVSAPLRPAWVRAIPRDDSRTRLNGFWTARVPRAARNGEAWLHEEAAALDEATRHEVAAMVRETKAAKPPGVQLSPRVAEFVVDLRQFVADDSGVGVDREARVEAWRVVTANLWWHQLFQRTLHARNVRTFYPLVGVEGQAVDTTMADWVVPGVWIDRIKSDRGIWNRFWYEDVASADLP